MLVGDELCLGPGGQAARHVRLARTLHRLVRLRRLVRLAVHAGVVGRVASIARHVASVVAYVVGVLGGDGSSSQVRAALRCHLPHQCGHLRLHQCIQRVWGARPSCPLLRRLADDRQLRRV